MSDRFAELRKTAVFAEEAFVVDLQSLLQGVLDERGWTRAQLAEALGVSRARVSQMFSDDCKNFTVRLLARALHALGEKAEVTTERRRKAGERRAAETGRGVRGETSGHVWATRWERIGHAANANDPVIDIGREPQQATPERFEGRLARALQSTETRRAA